MKNILVSLACTAALGAVGAYAQTPPRSFVTQHTTEINKHKIPYVAALEEFIVNNQAGQPAASLFATLPER